MKMLAMDLETSGLLGSQILELAMVVFDAEKREPLDSLERLHFYVSHACIFGGAYALQMNNKILRVIAGVDESDIPVVAADQVDSRVFEFCKKHFDSRITGAGKNIAMFDLTFFKKRVRDLFRSRVVDVGNLYWDGKGGIPDLQKCLDVAGLADRVVAHTALEDTYDVIELTWRRFDVK